MNNLYTIQTSTRSEPTILLPLEKKEFGAITSVAFGTMILPCEVEYREEMEQEIIIPESVRDLLKLPPNGKTHLIIHEETLHLGPLVGIFTAGFTDSTLRPIGERSLFFAKFLTVERSIGIFTFVFGAHHINWDEGTIEGLVYGKDGWKQMIFPFPNVVYDRLPNRRIENHSALKIVKNRLINEYSIPWYNPGFFNKWSIHQLLIGDEKVAKFLPETYHTPTIQQMEQMLSTYQSVYLKPANGSLGLGVFQLMYSREENQYYFRYRDDDEMNRLRKYPSLEHFLKNTFKNRKLTDYLAQQGIKLIRLDQNPIDFRVHTNKDQHGEWKVTAIGAKVAGKGSVTTHVNNGGVVKTLEEIYEDSRDRIQALHDLTEAAIMLSEAIDSKIKGFIGEIGFDFGIDQSGKVWMFEANSKPGRSIFSHPELKEADLTSRKLSLLYGLFLSEKAIKEPEEFNE